MIESQSVGELREFKPDGKFTAAGALNLLASMIVAAAVAGALGHFIGRFLNVVFVVSAGIGFLLAIAGGSMIEQYKIRNGALCLLAALIGGIAATGVMHYCDYLHHRSEVEALLADNQTLDDYTDEVFAAIAAEGEMDVEEVRRYFNKARSFPQYVDGVAQNGVSIGKWGQDSDLNLGYTGTYIYLLAEMAVVLLVAGWVMKGAAQRPFCPVSQDWFTLGEDTYTLPGDAQTVAAIIKHGDPEQFLKLKDLSVQTGATVIGVMTVDNDEAPADIIDVMTLKGSDGDDTDTVAMFWSPKHFTQQFIHFVSGEGRPSDEDLGGDTVSDDEPERAEIEKD